MSATFNPEFAEILSEAFSNCGIRPQLVTTEHLDEAIRSMNLALVKFSNLGVKQYNLQLRTITFVPGTASYSLPADVLDVWSAVTIRDGASTPIFPISRTDYQNIPRKTETGRPYNYFVDKGAQGTTPRTVYVWPAPDRADTLSYWAFVRETDQTDMAQVMPVSYEWIDAYATELGMRLAVKFSPDRYGLLKELAKEAFVIARESDRERAPVRFKMRGYIKQRAG